jgi:putative transcriptional regulator
VRVLLVLTLGLLLVGQAISQSGNDEPAVGKFLVASRKLRDPNFAEAVVLLIQHEARGSAGLIINRPTEMPISTALKEMKAAEKRQDPVYAGGPVSPGAVLALVRSRPKPEDAQRLFGDVYSLAGKASLERLLGSGVKRNELRIYIGYAGWSPGQLEAEIEAEAWHVMNADAGAVFDADPDSVWPRLIGRAGTRLAFRRTK